MFNEKSDKSDFRVQAFMEEDPQLKRVYKEAYEKAKEGILTMINFRKYQGH